MDIDLSALDAATIAPDATRRLALPELGITLILAPATEDNADFWAAGLVRAAEMSKVAGSGPPTPAAITEQRLRSAALFAEHVVKGWEGVKKPDGTPAPFSPAAALELLTKVVERTPRFWLRIDRFAANPDHFTAKAIEAAEVLAGNSSSG
jgi:hypothetical protein